MFERTRNHSKLASRSRFVNLMGCLHNGHCGLREQWVGYALPAKEVSTFCGCSVSPRRETKAAGGSFFTRRIFWDQRGWRKTNKTTTCDEWRTTKNEGKQRLTEFPSTESAEPRHCWLLSLLPTCWQLQSCGHRGTRTQQSRTEEEWECLKIDSQGEHNQAAEWKSAKKRRQKCSADE